MQIDATHQNLIVAVAANVADTNAGSITIRNWADGQLGINLGTDVAQPTTTGVFAGDYQKIDNGVYYSIAVNGNYWSDGSVQANAPDLLNGDNSANLMQGFGGNDGLAGGDGDDVIEGGDGADLLLGGRGADTIRGGDGADHIFGSDLGRLTLPTQVGFTPPAATGVEIARGFNWVVYDPPGIDGNGVDVYEIAGAGYISPNFEPMGNVIEGGAGNDRIAAGTGADVVSGGDDDDTIWGMGGSDTLTGGAGNDKIDGDGTQPIGGIYYSNYTPLAHHGNDAIEGGAGDDQLLGQGGDDALYGGDDNDSLFGDDVDDVNTPVSVHGSDWLEGGAGNDRLNGNGADDALFGGQGNDLLWGDDTFTDINPASSHGNDYLDGGIGDDQLTGGGRDDILDGGDGADLLWGDDNSIRVPDDLQGRDVLDGGAGIDQLIGGGSDDQLWGGTEDDFLVGDATQSEVAASAHGDDYLDGEAGDDVLVGGGGSDFLVGGLGVDTLHGDSNSEVLVDGAAHGADFLDGGEGADVLFGDGGADTLEGGIGDDGLYGDGLSSDLAGQFHGDDALEGGDGNDVILGNGGNDNLNGGAGDDTLIGDSENIGSAFGLQASYHGADRLDGGDGNDLLFGSGGDDTLTGGAGNDWLAGEDQGTTTETSTLTGNDWLDGGDGIDVLVGGNGDDTLIGGTGSDSLFGGAGRDTYVFAAGDDADVIFDASTNDHIVFIGETATPTLQALWTGGAPNVGQMQMVVTAGSTRVTIVDGLRGGDREFELGDGRVVTQESLIATMTSALQVTGSAYADTIRTGSGDDLLGGGDGDDRLYGGGGMDQIDGGEANDTLDAGPGGGMLAGGNGNDTYLFGRGDGAVAVDEWATDRATAIDTVRFKAGIAPSDLRLFNNGSDLRIEVFGTADVLTIAYYFASGFPADYLDRFEFDNGTVWTYATLAPLVVLGGSSGNDTLYGTAGDDQLHGLQGNDSLNGAGGNDQLFGDDGDDTLSGGTGNDMLDGGTGVNQLYGNDGDDVLMRGEYMAGGLGTDRYVIDSWDASFRLDEYGDKTASIDVLVLPASTTAANVGIERAWNSWTKGWDDLVLRAQDGKSILVYGFFERLPQENWSRVERIELGDGTVWTVADVLARQQAAMAATGGNNNIEGFSFDDAIDGLAGDDSIRGYRGNDVLLGGLGNDTLHGDFYGVKTFDDGNDTLDGGAGNDTLYGEGGNDVYRFGRGGGIDTIIDDTGIDQTALGSGIAQADVSLFRVGADLVLALDQGAAQLTVAGHFGSAAAQVESIAFADGSSWDAAAIQSHTIGGTANTMTGTAGNDSFVVDDTADVVVEAANQGTDTVQSSVHYTLPSNIENLLLTGYLHLRGTGNAANNTITGNVGNNLLEGGGGLDIVDGGAGDDELFGNLKTFTPDDGFADVLRGGTGNDTYQLGSSNDTVVELAGEGVDTVVIVSNGTEFHLQDNVENLTVERVVNSFYAPNLFGNAADNVIVGPSDMSGADIDGGAGADTLSGSSLGASFYVDNPGDRIVSTRGDVFSSIDWTLSAGLTTLTLTGGSATSGTGNDGDNVLVGTANLAANTLAGGLGHDTYRVHANDIVVESADAGTDTVELYGLTGTYQLGANVENAKLDSYVGTSTLTGNTLDNYLLGSDADNHVQGDDGNDTIIDRAWNIYTFATDADQLVGGNGDDVLYAYAGADTLDGGAGDDRLTVGDSRNAGGFLPATVLFGLGDGHDRLQSHRSSTRILFGTGIEPDAVVLSRSGADLVLARNGGQDSITIEAFFVDGVSTASRGLFDKVDFADGTSIAATQLVSRLLSGNSNTATTGSDALIGSAGDDAIDALAGDDAAWGRGGSDALAGGPGNDLLDGGSGSDTLEGDEGDDSLRGGDGADIVRFSRGDGSDTVIEAADDTLAFGPGIARTDLVFLRSDTDADLSIAIVGTADEVRIQSYFAGFDRLSIAFADGSTMDAAALYDAATAIIGTAAAETLTGTSYADRILGLGGNDTLQGLDGDDLLDGGTGTDTMQGGYGDDRYIVDATGDVVTEVSAAGYDRVESSVSVTLASNVEVLTLTGSAPLSGTGNSLNNELIGNAGNNALNGGTGSDTMTGGAGDDTYTVNVATDVVVENANEGIDAVLAGVSFALALNVENLTLTSTGNYSGTGNDLNNTLTGNSGTNQLIGGRGDDLYVVGTGDSVVENSNEGTDTVHSSITYSIAAFNNVENLTLTGSNAINGTGNAFANVLTGNSATNTLTGGAGNDTYIVGTGDVVSEAAGAGTDTVMAAVTWTIASTSNVENLTLTGSNAINGTGNTLANIITGNSAANALNGGTGADTLIGGAGNDTYTVDNTGDAITELANEGTDAVGSNVSYTLSANVENLTLTGSTAINGTGNALDNVLIGNSAVNTLTGGAGNDTYFITSGDVVVEALGAGTDTVQAGFTHTLASNVDNLTLTGTSAIGGTGNVLDNVLTGNSAINTLTGGVGNDTYVITSGDVVVEAAGAGTDTVQAGFTYTLLTHFENLSLTGSSAVNGIGNAADNILTGNGANNTLSGLAGNDTFAGAGGNDTLNDNSTTSNDTYRWGVGQGNDTVADSGGSADRIEIAAGVLSSQVTLTRSGNNLLVGIGGAADVLTVTNWYVGTANRIEEIRLADGSVIGAGAAPLSLARLPGLSGRMQRLNDSSARASTLDSSAMLTSAQSLVQAMAQFDAGAAADEPWMAMPHYGAKAYWLMPW